LYTAPATLPSQGSETILVVATDTNGNKYSASVNLYLMPPAPVITSVLPSPLAAGTTTVIVTGTGFTSSSTIWDGGVAYTTQMTPAGALTASVYTAPGTMSASFTVHGGGTVSSSFVVPVSGSPSSGGSSGNGGSGTAAAPVITTVMPTPIPVGTQTITIAGSGFVAGALVYDSFGSQSMIQYASSSVTAGSVTATIYQGSAATSTFCVKNPGSACSNSVTVAVNSGPPPPQSIAPDSISVNLGATQQFTSAGATAFAATAGSITSGGLYTAPTTMPSSGNVTVTATGPGGNASAAVTLINPNPQIVTPATVTLTLGATQQFTSAGGSNWTAINGTVDQTGFYTTPSVWPASGTDTVSVTGPDGKATAAITITPPTPAITSVGTGNQLPLGIFSATVTGTGFTAQSTATLGTNPVTVAYAGGALTISGSTASRGLSI
jgi:hypothetical protein